MSKIIKVIRHQDKKTIYLNIDHVVLFELEEKSGGSIVTTSYSNDGVAVVLWVDENPASLESKINSKTE